MGQAREQFDRFWTLIGAGKLDELSEIMDTNAEFKGPVDAVNGRANIVGYMRGWITACPDLRHEIVECIEVGDTFAAELIVRGTMTGPMGTPDGQQIPPTGKAFELRSCDYVRIAGGKLKSWHAYYDSMTVMVGLGLAPPPGAK